MVLQELLDACKNGDLEGVKTILGQGKVEVNCLGEDSQSPLMVASQYGHVSIVKALLRRDELNVSLTNGEGWEAIHSACEHGYPGIATRLLGKGAQVNAVTKTEVTPLGLACECCKRVDGDISRFIKCAEMLLELGADVNQADHLGLTPMHKACGYVGDLKLLKVLTSNGADVNKQAKDGHTPLIAASEQGHHLAVEFLLQHQAQPNKQYLGGASALYQACQNNHYKCVEALLKAGADLNLKQIKGIKPIQFDSKVHLGCLKTMKYRAKDDTADPRCLYGYDECQANLCEALQDTACIIDESGYTPVQVAAGHGNIDCVKLLLKAGVKFPWEGEGSPVITARDERQDEVLRVLQEHRNTQGN